MNRAYLIAEAGVNHGGHIRVALEMVEEAARAGVDAFKVQVYDPAKLATKDAPAYWDTTQEPTLNQRELFEAHAGLKQVDYEILAGACDKHGLDFVASVFHVEDVPWLARIVTSFKIASGDITHRPLLDAVAATEVPVILSTGASDKQEILAATRRFPSTTDLTLLHCTLSYPSRAEDANLSAIPDLLRSFGYPVGLSDHVADVVQSEGVINAAYVLGATVFEKHFSLTPWEKGNDHYHSLDAMGFVLLRVRLDETRDFIGSGGKRVLECELPAREGARRSLASVTDIPAGETIAPPLVCWKRPGGGITSYGFTARADIPADTTITAEMVV